MLIEFARAEKVDAAASWTGNLRLSCWQLAVEKRSLRSQEKQRQRWVLAGHPQYGLATTREQFEQLSLQMIDAKSRPVAPHGLVSTSPF